ncbi:MAG: exonuclease domain-containing protein [Blautia sp.]
MGIFDKLFKKKAIESQQSIPVKQDKQEKITVNMVMQKAEPTVKEQLKRGYVGTYKKQVDYATVEELKKRYIAFDVETTGLSPMNDKIIEVAAVLFENGEIIKRYSTFVNPEVFIPYSATAINHITNEMVKDAPKECIVYAELVDFLGDALKQQTTICAHNASFDMNFLSETLMRLGYDGKISYVDTLSLSRSLIKGLHNYKQDTVAMYFDLVNNQSHRAVTDAETCGKILWNLLQIEEKEEEKSKPCDEEMEICAYIQNCIMKNGGDSKWLGFYKNSSNYVDVSYLYSILKFKCAKKGKYIIVEKSSVGKLNCNIEPCTMSEGGSDYVRVYFNSPFELEPLESYLFSIYAKCRKSALDYFKYNKRYEAEHKNSPAMLNHLSDMDVAALLESAEKRKLTEKVVSETIENSNDKSRISREDITIQPIHNRVPLSGIRNKNNWEKGYDEGYPFWEKGDNLRKEGNVEDAIKLFDQARYNGYDAPVLYDSYAMAYHKLKDYANEIDILDEGIVRERKNGINVSRLEARRDKAIQLLYKQQEAEKKKLEKEQIKNENIKIISETSMKTTGRAILQLTDDMTLIKRYDTIAQAVRETGVNSKSIRDAAKGVQKHAGGYVWKYADEIGD